jgi:hypothetical protein
MYVYPIRFPMAANLPQNNNANSLVQLQRQASQTKISGVAKKVNGGTVGTGAVRRALRFLA